MGKVQSVPRRRHAVFTPPLPLLVAHALSFASRLLDNYEKATIFSISRVLVYLNLVEMSGAYSVDGPTFSRNDGKSAIWNSIKMMETNSNWSMWSIRSDEKCIEFSGFLQAMYINMSNCNHNKLQESVICLTSKLKFAWNNIDFLESKRTHSADFTVFFSAMLQWY